jgi:hypothetical protein
MQPAALRRGLKKGLFEEPGATVIKALFAIVASAEHMVDRSRKLQPRFPRHLATVIKRKDVFYRTDPVSRGTGETWLAWAIARAIARGELETRVRFPSPAPILVRSKSDIWR